MARTDNLTNFLTDIANSIRTKTGETGVISPANMDMAIESIPSGETKEYFAKASGSNISVATNRLNLFIKEIPYLDTSNVTNMTSMFAYSQITTIPLLDTSNSTTMVKMFQGCSQLTSLPLINTSKCTNMEYMIANCSSIQAIPSIDCSQAKYVDYMFYGDTKLVTIPRLDFGNVINCQQVVGNCSSLVDVGGFKDLGKAYDSTKAAGTSAYGLSLTNCSKLTHDSIMNIINDLYDIKSIGCNAQNLYLGNKLLPLISDEEKQIAIDKGWTVS